MSSPYIAPVSRRGISSVIGPFGAVAKRGAFSFLALTEEIRLAGREFKPRWYINLPYAQNSGPMASCRVKFPGVPHMVKIFP